MAASAKSSAPNPTVCPDPSVHEKAHKQGRLQDQAAGAALYNTNSESINPLGPDNKLSSAGAASSLKYARAQDLPSFPSVGIDTKNSGLAAAKLANSNKTVIEWYKPTLSADASKAAMLAKDYKMEPLWQPEASAAGSKAAILAAKAPGRDWWQPQASKDGHSAATMAMRNKGLSPQLDYGYTETGHRNSMLAAQHSIKGRKRADSTPVPTNSYPDAHNAASNALSAATMANTSANASRLGPNSMSREMYTSHPPVDIEVQEKKHQDALQASAISMAKKMYAIQRVDDDGNITLDHSQVAASAAADIRNTPERDLKSQAMQYLTLQDTAQKLAAERLAKIGNPHENAAFQDYYGYPAQKRKSRLSIRNRDRRPRASSEGADVDSDDDRRARRVRSQMNQFNTQLAQVDAKKRQQDRSNLMAAAEKKVHAQMNKMDEKIFNDTGKMSPAMVEEWDAKARAKAAASSEARMEKHGKVNIGGGKYIDQSEIDAIAAARIQPTLDEINDTAAKHRARDEEVREEQAEKKRETQIEKERQAKLKAEEKRIKHEEKEAERKKKHEEKQAEKDKKAALKSEKRKSTEVRPTSSETTTEKAPTGKTLVKKTPTEQPTPETAVAVLPPENIGTGTEPVMAATVITVPVTIAPPATSDSITSNLTTSQSITSQPVTTHSASSHPTISQTPRTLTSSATDDTMATPATSSKPTENSQESPTKPKKRFSTLLGKLKRKPKDKSEDSEKKGFQGGAAYTGATTSAAQSSAAAPIGPTQSSSSISSLSSDEPSEPRGRTKSRASSGGSDDFEEARDNFDERLVPPPTFGGSQKSNSPIRETKFHEAL